MIESVNKYDASNYNKAAVIYKMKIWELATTYSVEFSDSEIDEILSRNYNLEIIENKELIEAARRKTEKIMETLSIEESEVLTNLEIASVIHILRGYESASEEDVVKMVEALKLHNVSDEIKAAVIHKMRIWELAKEYNVVFSGEEIDEILKRECNFNALSRNTNLIATKKHIKSIMDELRVSHSVIIDAIEREGLFRICSNYQTADKDTCLEMIKKIEAYDALDKNKEPYMKYLSDRLKVISKATLDERLKELYLSTNIKDTMEVAKTISYINENIQTDSAKEYLAMLKKCNAKNVRKAAKAQLPTAERRVGVSIIMIVVGIIYAIMRFLPLLGIVAIIFGIISISNYAKGRKLWEMLTKNRTVMHPILVKELSSILRK